VAMPPLSWLQLEVSCTSQYWPSAEGSRVTAPRRSVAHAAAPAASARSRVEVIAMPRIRARALASMAQAVDDVVDAQLVGLVRVADRPKTGAGPLPELRDVGVVVDDHLQPLAGIVVFEEPAKDRTSGDVGLRNDRKVVDLEERVEDRMRRVEV